MSQRSEALILLYTAESGRLYSICIPHYQKNTNKPEGAQNVGRGGIDLWGKIKRTERAIIEVDTTVWEYMKSFDTKKKANLHGGVHGIMG